MTKKNLTFPLLLALYVTLLLLVEELADYMQEQELIKNSQIKKL